MLYLQAYSDLAFPTLKKTDINHINAIEERTYIPFPSLNTIFQQIVGHSEEAARSVIDH